MCQLCALASRSQKYRNNPQLLNRPLSVLVNLNPKTPQSNADARPVAPVSNNK